MKQAMEFCAGGARPGVENVLANRIVGDITIYTQAIWRLCARSFGSCLGVSKKGRGRSQARYEQRLDHRTVAAGADGVVSGDVVSGDIVSVIQGNAMKDAEPVKSGVSAVENIRLPAGALTEIRSISNSILSHGMDQSQNMRQELSQLLPALAGFCQQRWLVLVAPPCVPTVAELTLAGLDPARVLLVHAGSVNGFTVLEKALRSGTCGAVLAWLADSDMQALERLRRAAEEGNAWGVLFRTEKQQKAMQRVLAFEDVMQD